MKTFSSFIGQIDEIKGVAPKAKGEHKFVHSTYLNQIKDPGDLEKVGPEEIGPHDTKAGSGKRPLDRLDNKQKFGESVDLEENYRALAQKGIGAERKQDIKVGHGVDYYHPKDGSKHIGKIHDMDDKGYTVKDDKTGEKHKFDYFRKEEVEHVKEGRGAYDELARRMGTSSPGFNKTPAGKAREQKRRQDHLKDQMKFTQRMGGLTGPKSKLPEEVESVAEDSGPQKGDHVYYGSRLVGTFLGHSKHGKVITKANHHEMGHNRDVHWDKDAVTIKKKGVAEEVELEEGSSTSRKPYRDINSPEYKAAAEKQREKMAKDKAAEPGKKLLDKIEKKGMREESELEEADFSKAQTKMAHAIGKHFKSKGIGDESKGGPFAVASAMVRDKPDAAKKAYATIKSKMKNEDHQDMLMALYDSLSEENRDLFDQMIEVDQEKLLEFAKTALSNYEGE